jgi:hypothetical protein
MVLGVHKPLPVYAVIVALILLAAVNVTWLSRKVYLSEQPHIAIDS